MRTSCLLFAGMLLFGSACTGSDTNGRESSATDPRVIRLERALTRVDLCPSWSPDGRKLVFPARARPQDPTILLSVGGGDLTIIKTDGTGERRIAAFRGDDPDWSPDGRRILYFDGGPAVLEPLKTVNLDGTESGTIPSPSPISAASWSPDGEQIAFSETVNKGSGGAVELSTWITVADARGRDFRTIVGPRDGSFQRPAWSSDGERIVFGDGYDIEVVNRDGSELRTLFQVQGEVGGEPAWSSRDQIAFEDGGDLFVIDADGSGLRQVTSLSAAGGFDSCPDWSPDGKQIAFSRSVGTGLDERSAIFVINFDGSGEHQVTQTKSG